MPDDAEQPQEACSSSQQAEQEEVQVADWGSSRAITGSGAPARDEYGER